MKSIAERKAERDAREKRERMKRTPGTIGIYRNFNIPAHIWIWNSSEGDRDFLKKKAQQFISICKTDATPQFYTYLKEMILEEERVRNIPSPVEQIIPTPGWILPTTLNGRHPIGSRRTRR